jgi:hypothetical protein
LRAGLLSEQEVITLLNDRFVSTWVLVDELKQRAEEGDTFAESLLTHWEYPLDLMFLNQNGQFVTKLNSFRDLPNAHPDVGHHGDPFGRFGPTHREIFLARAAAMLSARDAEHSSP